MRPADAAAARLSDLVVNHGENDTTLVGPKLLSDVAAVLDGHAALAAELDRLKADIQAFYRQMLAVESGVHVGGWNFYATGGTHVLHLWVDRQYDGWHSNSFDVTLPKESWEQFSERCRAERLGGSE